MKRLMAAAALAVFAISGHATLTPTTVSGVTTLTEEFNGGAGQCSYMTFVNAHCIPGTVRYPDGYLNIAPGLLNDSASASFDRVYGLTSTDITVEFWYSSSISTLPNIPGNQGPLFAFNGESFNLNSTGGILATTHNPGANFAPSTHQAHFSHTFHAVVGGNHTLTFSTGAGNYRTLNVDDLKITVTSVPEPETYAMLLAGLGLIGAVARRRQSKQA